MQALYAVETGAAADASAERAVSAVRKSADRFLDMYYYMLQFLAEFRHLLLQAEDDAQQRYIVNKGDLDAMRMASQNPVIKAISESEELAAILKKRSIAWSMDPDTMRRVLNDLRKTPVWSDYVALSAMGAAPTTHLPLALIRDYALEHPSVTQALEENFINWHDDKKIVGQMVVKSIQNMGNGESLVPQLERFGQPDPATFTFAEDLIRVYLMHKEELDGIVKARITKWDPSLVAVVDLCILKMASAEFLYFLSIPSTVTINEYIEMAKAYSAPNSRKFVNGVLDVIWKQIKEEGKIAKA